MELEFDKEIDALLRKARADGPVLVGDVAGSRHLDADQISAFAENSLPERSRMQYMSHLADCDRCRKILSNVLTMTSEAVPAAVAAPGAITIAERELPWYRKLLLFPNLAYVMGGLVLIFGGFLAFSVIQNSRLATGDMVTQVSETRESGPSFQTDRNEAEDSAANTMANVAASNTAITATNTNSAIASATPPVFGGSGPRASENNFLTDGVSAGDVPAAPPPPASTMSAPRNVGERDDAADKEKREDKDVAAVMPQEQAKSDSMLKQQQYSNMPAQSGPSRQNESQYRAQLENSDRRALAKKSRARDEESSGRKVVSGKTFEQKQGVWYDVTYQGRPTINVRRGSDEFNRLDAGLRSIANSLSGTVVVVWGAKAYRIQ